MNLQSPIPNTRFFIPTAVATPRPPRSPNLRIKLMPPVFRSGLLPGLLGGGKSYRNMYFFHHASELRAGLMARIVPCLVYMGYVCNNGLCAYFVLVAKGPWQWLVTLCG